MSLKKLSMFLFFALFLLLTGCGTAGEQYVNGDNQQEPNTQGNDLTELLNALKLDVNIQQMDETKTVLFNISLTNQSSEEFQLTFPSGQQIEIKVNNEAGEHIYTYSMDKSFIQAIQDVPIQAGESIEWQEEWIIDENIPSGHYEAIVEIVASHINGQEMKNTTLQVNKSFQININSTSFRNIEVTGDNGEYLVKGEARVFEGVFFYTVEEGHEYLVEETLVTVDQGAPEWSSFEIPISISEDQLPVNGTLTLDLFERSAKDNSIVNEYFVKLDEFGY